MKAKSQNVSAIKLALQLGIRAIFSFWAEDPKAWAYEKGRPGRPRPPLGVGLVIVLNTVGLENSNKKKSSKKK